MTFAHTLSTHRARLGITQAQAAAMLGVSASIIAKWETNNRTPRPMTQASVIAILAGATTKP